MAKLMESHHSFLIFHLSVVPLSTVLVAAYVPIWVLTQPGLHCSGQEKKKVLLIKTLQ